MNARLHLTVFGDVQGVFFRDFARRTAQQLRLTGWVRNTPEGTVEVVAEGEKEQLENLLAKCREGPPTAKVERVKAEWEKPTKKFKTFIIKY